MEILISLLIFLLIAALIFWVIGLIPLPDPFKTITYVVMAIIFIIVLIGYLTGDRVLVDL